MANDYGLPNIGTMHVYRPGLNNVGSYMVSGRPYLTGSALSGSYPNNGEVMIEFPSVTKSFTIINRSGNTCLIHFDSRANTDVITYHHYMSLPNQHDSYGFDVKCRKIYVSMLNSADTGEFELHAELTGIEKEEMHPLTGSGINSAG